MKNFAEFHAETNPEKKEQELGDVFFSLINYAKFLVLMQTLLWNDQSKIHQTFPNARKIGFRKES